MSGPLHPFSHSSLSYITDVRYCTDVQNVLYTFLTARPSNGNVNVCSDVCMGHLLIFTAFFSQW